MTILEIKYLHASTVFKDLKKNIIHFIVTDWLSLVWEKVKQYLIMEKAEIHLKPHLAINWGMQPISQSVGHKLGQPLSQ